MTVPQYDDMFAEHIRYAAQVLRNIDNYTEHDSFGAYTAPDLDSIAQEYENEHIRRYENISELTEIIQHHAGSGAWKLSRAEEIAQDILKAGWSKDTPKV